MSEECAEIIDCIIKIRKQKGITQKQLAYCTKINQSAIARLESKKVIPTIETLLKIASALDIKIKMV